MTSVFAADRNSCTVAAQLFHLVIDYSRSQGVTTEDLLARASIRAEELEDSDHRLPFPVFSRLTETAAEMLDDPHFGLHAGIAAKPGYLGALGHVLMSCRTVHEALDRSRRYSGLVINACRNELEIGERECFRYWRSRLANREPVGPLQDEMNAAVWIRLARWISGLPELAPNRVEFHHPAPHDRSEHERIFGCPVIFECPETVLVFPTQWLELKLPQANRTILQTMDRVCEQLLDRLAREQLPAALRDVRQAIMRAFPDGTPTLEDVAREVRTPPEQLKSMLADARTSFRSLVDELRHELALSLLENPDYSLVDIAFLLGFSEQSAFQRAFKRWAGQTPGEYRRHPWPGAAV
ncbi:MAG: AraC family transcriptional regulator [Wenzhouxiangellaceae bacterium]